MRLFPDIYVPQVRLSNGAVVPLRLLPGDAQELWLNLGVALGALPALPATNDEDSEGEAS